MFKVKKDEETTSKYEAILSKMIELEKAKKKINPIKVTICVVGGVGSIVFIITLCYSFLKNGFSLENILSMLLAFFSIFISIFFYFKADETSMDFYNTSYQFMKDISVTLGKIEERFGEKLNSLNEKISHFDQIRTEANAEIADKEGDKERIIDDLMNKANLNDEEKRKYREELAKKDEEIDDLKKSQYQAIHEARMLRRRLSQLEREDIVPLPSKRVLEDLLDTHDLSNITPKGINYLRKLGLIDENGTIYESSIIRMLDQL